MIFYNWEKIKEYTRSDCVSCLKLLRAMTEKQKITRVNIMLLAKLEKAGNKINWLDKPMELLQANASSEEKCIYIELAALRNRYTVVETGINKIPLHYLDLKHFDINKLRWNKLLMIQNDGIYFKY